MKQSGLRNSIRNLKNQEIMTTKKYAKDGENGKETEK
jgi:hypothetical protein